MAGHVAFHNITLGLALLQLQAHHHHYHTENKQLDVSHFFNCQRKLQCYYLRSALTTVLIGASHAVQRVSTLNYTALRHHCNCMTYILITTNPQSFATLDLPSMLLLPGPLIGNSN